ncbi:4-hydroxy-tetrahydrodipicolinate synthase [Dokdonella sp.]|uniref:4-hydroxy-tetrahydrodipicolinate synthase n=1 Tax=Dokdonella sp. TaxID=2291710 RepID=UPI0035275DAC
MNLSGSICALATPFHAATEALDLDAFGRLIEFQIGAGTRGLVVAGSTGEGAALESEEFFELVKFAVNTVAGRVPLLAGSGLQSTRKTIAQTRLAARAGADAALVVTPAYVRPTQEGLYRHFGEVADQGGLPVMLYNVPSRTGCDLLPQTVARLHAQSGIVGIKEARPEVERMSELLALKSGEFSILSGDDPSAARSMRMGADGVISVVANVAPAQMQELCDLAGKGDDEALARADKRLHGLYDLVGVEPNPIPVKWCLQRMGFGSEVLRLPLLALSAAYHAQADRVLADLGLAVAASSCG